MDYDSDKSAATQLGVSVDDYTLCYMSTDITHFPIEDVEDLLEDASNSREMETAIKTALMDVPLPKNMMFVVMMRLDTEHDPYNPNAGKIWGIVDNS